MFNFSKKNIRRIFRYIFSIVLILWVITSVFILYKYVWFSSNKINSKGGTFVEGIFNSTSYLPYLRSDLQSYFYQGLLFNSCLKYFISPEGIQFNDDLCSISTKDDKEFVVKFDKKKIWSDGTPLSLDDILFTYQEAIINNKRGIRNLTVYKDISITKESENSIKVIFPTKSIDNKLFFTNYILPKHILEDYDFQKYREIFALQPVYTNCANIVSQKTDQYSLIFNLVNCENTNLNFYQIKNHESFDVFAETINNKKRSIVDVYIGNQTFQGYEQYNLSTNKIITLFFNTNSEKLRVRTRRALGGLIKHNFYITGYDKYLVKNDDGLFDYFLSTGLNIKDFLNISYDQDTVIKKDLIDSGIKPISWEINIKGENQNFVFYTETGISKKELIVNFENNYDKIGLEYNQKNYGGSYLAKDKKAKFIIGKDNNTFSTGLNKYTIVGRKNNKKIIIANIDLYNVVEEITVTNSPKNQISIIYYNDPIYNAIVLNLQSIFTKFNISDYFTFERINNLEEFEGKILLNEYDIVINTIDMGLKRDITKLFATDSLITNPSQYQNNRLISLLQQYTQKTNDKTLNEINDIYSKDMPLIILGKEFVPLQIKIGISEKLPGLKDELQLYEYNRRELIYNNIQLVNTIHIDGKKIWEYDNFVSFIKNSLGLINKNETNEENDNFDLDAFFDNQ